MSEIRVPPLRWPPPGLERLQGDLGRVAGRGALAGGLLVLPLLFVTARRHDVASLGPFADAWWVTLVLATVGLGFALDALSSAARALRRTADAITGGYDVRTVAYVLADSRKDMGFLLQGGRHFSVMDPGQRQGVATLRVLAIACMAAAGLWLPVALGVTLVAGARAALDPTAVWAVTLVPAGALYLAGGLVRVLEDARVRRARSAWFDQPWASDLVPEEIETWRRELAERRGEEPSQLRRTPGGARLRRAATVVGVLAALAAVPVLTLVPTSAIGPVLALLALPRLSQVQERAARVEAYRGYRVVPDPGVSAAEAGGILQDLLYVGSRRAPVIGEREPGVRYDAPWLPEPPGAGLVGAEPHRWAEELFARVAAGPSPELVAFLAGVAEHPAQAAFTRLARAGDADIAAGRWSDAPATGLTVARLPIPRFGGIREGAYAHLASAGYDLARGRPDDAEEKIREVISLGFVLGDQGPTLLDNLIGHVIVATGGTALGRFYEVTGRGAEAREIHALEEAAQRTVRRIHAAPPEGTEAFVRSLPSMVLDTGAVRGLRWEYFVLTATLTPCLNLHRMVFGPDDEYRRFVQRARSALVRWPSEERLFDIAQAGYWGATDPENQSLFGRFLGISMRPGEGSCSDVVRRFDTLKEAR